MKPIVAVETMREIDGKSVVPQAELIRRAAWAVSRQALSMMGGGCGRRVVVIAGPGNNGADGRLAASFLRDRGANVVVVAPDVRKLPSGDLVIDAAYGTGFRGEYTAPDLGDVPILAVDIPSGVDGDTGVASAGAVHATTTVTFAALKPGQLMAAGPVLCGSTHLVDIGLLVDRSPLSLYERDDFVSMLPTRGVSDHKWRSAVGVVSGSSGMRGACRLVTAAAMRSGAGMVRVLQPGLSADDVPVTEAVGMDGRDDRWSKVLLEGAERLRAVVIGPGIGRSEETRREVLTVLASASLPVVVDADALHFLVDDDGIDVVRRRTAPTVVTPHDGEFSAMFGKVPGHYRYRDVQEAARRLNATVLLKGSTTIVANPAGETRFVTAGDARLASAGTGDVLSGVIVALLARGLDPLNAATAAAYVHGAAAMKGFQVGFIASDLPELIAAEMSSVASEKVGNRDD